MNEILFHYEKIDPTTWVYLASLLIIGLFFKFGRFWSVRNLDLLLLILLAPGLLLVSEGQEIRRDAMAAIAADQKATQENAPPDATPPSTETPSSTDSPLPAIGDSANDASTDATTADSSEAGLDPNVIGERNRKKTREDQGSSADAEQVDRLSSAREELKRGQTIERIGFIWLLLAAALLLIRLLVDPTMVRRPLLEPNLTTGGLTFSCCSLFVFLMANVVASSPTSDDLLGPTSAERLLKRRASEDLDRHGPGYALVFMLPSLPTVKMGANLARERVDDPSVRIRRWLYRQQEDDAMVEIEAEFLDVSSEDTVQLRELDGTDVPVPLADLSEADRAFVKKIRAYTTIAKLVAILSHLAIVVGVIAIGYWHFYNVKMGIGAATLYLMLPYTSQMTGRVDHVLPAAFLVWAVLCYRRPLISGVFIGLAIGVVYYPLFLLPLWFSFYWRRGLLRFTISLVCVLAVMILMLALVSPDVAAFWQCIKKMFGLMPPQMVGLGGIWGLGWAPFYRYPVLAAFIALCGSLAIWPAQKNLGTLLSCSAAIMVATQFWHGYGGGLYMAWYIPLFLLTIFRPNLEDRIASSVIDEGWMPRKQLLSAS